MVQYENEIEACMKAVNLLSKAVEAMKNSPPPCMDDCKYRNRHQKCTCCVRNYKNLKDCYEREG